LRRHHQQHPWSEAHDHRLGLSHPSSARDAAQGIGGRYHRLGHGADSHQGGVIQSVEILSGPRIFHAAVKAAMMQYKCVTDGAEVVATQVFDFKID